MKTTRHPRLSLVHAERQLYETMIAVPYDLDEDEPLEWIIVTPKQHWVDNFRAEMCDRIEKYQNDSYMTDLLEHYQRNQIRNLRKQKQSQKRLRKQEPNLLINL